MNLPLPIAPVDALYQIIGPALRLLPPTMTSDEARVLLLAMALQESSLNARVQHANGPAHGLWQNERGGGVAGVLGNEATERYARSLCAVRGVPATSYSLWMALAGDDILAAAIARLILWADPRPLPALGDVDGAWQCYLRNWRPGKPRPDDWAANYAAARKALTA